MGRIPKKCPFCDRLCSTKYNLRRHVQSIHDTDIPLESRSNFKCSICSEGFHFFREFVAHHRVLHGFYAKYETQRFASMEEFKAWKEQVERNTHTLFSASTGSKTLTRGITKWYLRCHRSGTYVPRGTGSRQLKSQGSVKTGQTCLAYMTVYKKHEQVYVKYQSLHLGHDLELCHAPLTASDKARIAEKLREGVALDAVLESIREDFDGALQRIHLVTRRDLHNIMRSFKIASNNNDDVSMASVDKSPGQLLQDTVPSVHCQQYDPQILSQEECDVHQEEVHTCPDATRDSSVEELEVAYETQARENGVESRRSVALAEALVQQLKSTELDADTENIVETALESIFQTVAASSICATGLLSKQISEEEVTQQPSDTTKKKKTFRAAAPRKIKHAHEERERIASALLNPTEVLHTGFDHTYTNSIRKLKQEAL